MRIANPTGALGENLAVTFLKKKGYTILERNYRKRYGEIDIIALSPKSHIGINAKKELLVFIEVKTRTSMQFGSPLEAIGKRKLQEIVQTALYYKMAHKGLPELMRIDAISILLHPDEKMSTIEHVENISA